MKNILVSVGDQHLETYLEKIFSDLRVSSMNTSDSNTEWKKIINENKYDLLVSQIEHPAIIEWTQKHNPTQPVLVLTLDEIHKSLNELLKFPLVKSVIGQKSTDLEAVRKYVKAAIQKIVTNDYFGIEKYMTPIDPIKKWVISSSSERAGIINEIRNHLQAVSIRASLIDQCGVVAEEMMMNAIYDAPTDNTGSPLFNHMSRTQEVRLNPDQRAMLQLAYDDKFVAISIQDPFGGLSKEIIFSYLKSCYDGIDLNQKSNKGGAGRGIQQIIENADLVVFNVLPKKQTEVICFIARGVKRETAKLFPSFQYFMI